MTAPAVTSLLQGFFTERLARQLQASPQTVSAYRDTIKLLLLFAAQQDRKSPIPLSRSTTSTPSLSARSSATSTTKGITARRPETRGWPRSTPSTRYALPLIPDRAHTASQVLAIPQRRHDRAIVSYLTGPETDALLAAPDRTTWHGRRDHALLLTAVQTPPRLSEVTGLTLQDVTTTTPGAAVHTTGKGRTERATPLTRQTVAVLRAWLHQRPDPRPAARPSRHGRGTRMSADAVQRLVARHAATAARDCPSITSKHVTPHTLRHTAAMALMNAGVDTSVIALWLGHQSAVTTHIYLHADMTIKERALARVPAPNTTPGRYRPADDLIDFLERL